MFVHVCMHIKIIGSPAKVTSATAVGIDLAKSCTHEYNCGQTSLQTL